MITKTVEIQEEEILNIDHHKKILIEKAVRRSKTVKEAAERLEIGERHLFNLMRRYNMPKFKEIKRAQKINQS